MVDARVVRYHPARSDQLVVTGDVSHRRAFASRNCVISGANLCGLVRTCRESVANLRKPVAN
eukprot:1604003-Prymnesium_polylepis.2